MSVPDFDNVAAFPKSALWTRDQLIDLADSAYKADARETCISAIEALYGLFDAAE